MGAWGPGVFENDAALDWLAVARRGDAREAIESALRAAIEAEYLDVDEGAAAVAAAAIIASACDGQIMSLPEDARSLAADFVPEERARGAAGEALRAVLGPRSELASLWSTSAAWRGMISNLLDRIARTTAP